MRDLALWLSLFVLAGIAGCGPGIPDRFVLERDVDEWSYRRYQHVLDVEFAVEGNQAEGHTATYVQRARRTSRTIPYANAFVSVYSNPQGLALELRRQVRALASYEVSVRDLGGGRVWYLDAGPGDRWAVWVSGQHIVKIGASDGMDDVPESIVSAYMGIYSSDLDENGRAQDGRPSAGELPSPEVSDGSGEGEGEGEGEGDGEGDGDGDGESDEDDDDDMPAYLRDNAPR